MSVQGGISPGMPDRVPDARISKEVKTLLNVSGDGENHIYPTPSQGEDSVWLMEDCDDLSVTGRRNAEVDMDAG